MCKSKVMIAILVMIIEEPVLPYGKEAAVKPERWASGVRFRTIMCRFMIMIAVLVMIIIGR